MILAECAPASHLYIAVPAYGGQITAETTHSLCVSAILLERAGIGVEFDFGLGNCYLDHVRNQLATRFYRSGASDLLFVDADVSFEPAAVLRIASAKRPFVAGIYPMKDDGQVRFPVWFEADELWADADGLVEAARVPTGFLRLNRAVMEAMAGEPYDDGASIDFFHVGIRDGRYWGEDIDFCDRWRALGGAIHIIPDLTFGHSGMKRWTGNWGEDMKSRLPKPQAPIECTLITNAEAAD